jgi:NAD(P)-dependent dehydrogenase (short-subunit alcohol dehydrogenase family)
MRLTRESVAIVTGASRGIGREASLAFARKGVRVVLASRNIPRLEELSREISAAGSEALIVPCDVSLEAECKQMVAKAVDRFGRVDVLMNNAGFGYYAAVENMKTEDLQKIFLTNLYGAIWCTQAVIPHMKSRRAGHIVNVSTVLSRRSVPYMTGYCMTKFALNGMDEGLRLELRPFGIGVTLVCPGLTETDFQSNADRIGYAPPIRNEGGMSPAKVGRIIVRCVERNRRRVALTLSGKILLGFQRISPALTDEILHLAFSWKLGRQEPRP